MRRALLLISLWASSAFAVTVPADLAIGPAGYWFFGPLTSNRGAVPHFAIAFDLAAVIDKEWIERHPEQIPARYRSMASRVNEVRIGPSIFIPSTLYVSPPIDPLGSVGLFGLSWTPLGLTLVNAGKESRFTIDAHLLLTTLVIFNTMDYPGVPFTVFFRPGAQVTAQAYLKVTDQFGLGLGGGGQIYVPQRLGNWLEFGPLEQAIFVTAFAFLQFHFRFPYEAAL